MAEKFNFFMDVNLEKSINKKTGKREMYVSGVASTPDKDFDDEELQPNGFDIKRFLDSGVINYNHLSKADPTTIIGEPVEAYVKNNQFFVKALLYSDVPLAVKVWETMENLEKSGAKRKMGWSIEGKATERNMFNPKKIEKAIITGMALTPVPKNANTFADLCKGVQEDDFQEEQPEISKGVLFSFEKDGEEFIINKDFEIVKAIEAGATTGTQTHGETTSGASLKKEALAGDGDDDEEGKKKVLKDLINYSIKKGNSSEILSGLKLALKNYIN